MNEDVPILPLVVGGLLVAYFGFEVRRRRDRLRSIFNLVDKEESRMAEELERMVASGELKPYVPSTNHRLAVE